MVAAFEGCVIGRPPDHPESLSTPTLPPPRCAEFRRNIHLSLACNAVCYFRLRFHLVFFAASPEVYSRNTHLSCIHCHILSLSNHQTSSDPPCPSPLRFVAFTTSGYLVSIPSRPFTHSRVTGPPVPTPLSLTAHYGRHYLEGLICDTV